MAKQRLILDRYRPTAKAGSGGFATVYKAWDTLMQRDVAIKEIKLSETDAARAARSSGGHASILLPWEEPEDAWGETARDAFDPDRAADSLGSMSPNARPRRRRGTGTDTLKDAFAPFPKDPDFLGGGYADVPDDQSQEPHLNVEQQRFLSHIPGLDEARTAAFLQDPCIVAVYDLQIQDTTAYLIMEYVEGMSLTRFLKDFEDYLTLDIIASIFHDVSQAIQTAHANNVLHLDIKPDNILINMQGRVKVTDFGLATLSDAEGQGTAGGGTIGYMPLEQMRQQPLDARTDEWSLASITYEMLSGENPFLARDLDDAAAAIENAELVLPHLMWDELDPAADDVLFYALDPKQENRYETVEDFAEEMARFLGSPKAGQAQLEALMNGAGDDAFDDSDDNADYDDLQGETGRRGLLALLSPKRGSRKGKAALPAGDEPQDQPRPRDPKVPPSQKLGPVAQQVISRVGSVCLCGFLNLFCLINLPRVEAFSAPLMWTLIIGGIVACIIRPHLGALVSFLILGVSLCCNGAPAFGVLLIAATLPWWWFVGRRGEAAAHLALSFPLLGGVALAPMAPALTGLFLSAGRAVATTLLGALACLGLACVSTLSLTGWDAVTNFTLAGSLGEVQGHIMQMVTDPTTWLVALSWVLAAAAMALCCKPRWKWLAFLGSLVSAALIAIGPLAAQLVQTGLTAVTPNLFELVPAILAFVVCGATSCMEVPRRTPRD